ncbi:hypothetical protein [Lottiidibacillus patelloidae]|uniref:hypothetical protein n=1 Tax=Lottiidibacillus patelloidae TaxID=2670334 RepID=UPI0013036F2F|nr:hypothetical protein [Lottiidibacillus patelloidae]
MDWIIMFGVVVILVIINIIRVKMTGGNSSSGVQREVDFESNETYFDNDTDNDVDIES